MTLLEIIIGRRVNSPAAHLLIALLLVVAGNIACDETQSTSPTAPGQAPTTVTVSGRVIDYSTGAPASRTTLEWHGISSMRRLPAGTVTTDDAGNYTVSLVAADFFTVTLAGRQVDTVIVPTRSYQTDFLVNPGACVLMYGVLFNAVTKLPVSGARVEWFGEAITDSAGVYRMELGCGRTFGTGTTSVRITHPAFATIMQPHGRRESYSNGAIERLDQTLTPLSGATLPLTHE